MDVDTVLGLSAAGVHDAVERWASRTAVVPERQLWLHVEGSEANGGWAAQLAVTHRQQLLLQFRHVLVHHEVSIRGVPAGSTVVLASAGGSPVHHDVSVRVNGRLFDARLRRRRQWPDRQPKAPNAAPPPVWASDDPWGAGLRLCVGPQATGKSITFRFTVAEAAGVPTVGSAEKPGIIRTSLTRLAATASTRAGSPPETVAVDNTLKHAEIHMPAKVHAVEMRGVELVDRSSGGKQQATKATGTEESGQSSVASSAWEIGTDRTFAALRRDCALQAGAPEDGLAEGTQLPLASTGPELRVKVQTLWKPCAIFRGCDDADSTGSAAAGAGMIHLPPAGLKTAKRSIAEQDVSVVHFLVDGTAAMRGPSIVAARDTVLACLATIRSDIGGRLGNKRLGLQIEVFGSEDTSSALLCSSGPIKCDDSGLASAEKWAREHIHSGRGGASSACSAAVNAVARLSGDTGRPSRGQRCIALITTRDGDEETEQSHWARFLRANQDSSAKSLGQHTTLHCFLVAGAGCSCADPGNSRSATMKSFPLRELAESTGGHVDVFTEENVGLLPTAATGLIRSSVLPRLPALAVAEWFFGVSDISEAGVDAVPDWTHAEPCHRLQARAGSGGPWAMQSLLGPLSGDQATARISLIDTAGNRHAVAILATNCATAGMPDPLVSLCARDTVLNYFDQSDAHVWEQEQRNCRVAMGDVELATNAASKEHGIATAIDAAARDAVSFGVHVVPLTEFVFDGLSIPLDARPPCTLAVPAIDGERQPSSEFQTSVLEAFQQYVHEYIDAFERKTLTDKVAFWTDVAPYTLPVDDCAARVYAQLLSEQAAQGELDEHGCSMALQREIERSALPVCLQLRALPIACLYARLTTVLVRESGSLPSQRGRGQSKPEEAEDGSIKIFPCWDSTVLVGREVLQENVEFCEGSLGLRVATNPYFSQTTNAEDAYAVFVDGFNRDDDNEPGPAESCGKVELGDFIVAINGQSVRGQSDTDVLGSIKAARRPVTISFCRPNLVDQSDGSAKVSFGGTVPAHTVSRSHPGWGTTMSAVFAWDTELLQKVVSHASPNGSRVSLELPCKMFGRRPVSVRHRVRVIDSAQIGVSSEVQPTLIQVVDTQALADAVFALKECSSNTTELAQYTVCAWTRCITVIVPDAIVKRTIADKAFVIVVEEMPASAADDAIGNKSETDSLHNLGGQCATVVYSSAACAEGLDRPRICVEEREGSMDGEEENESSCSDHVQCTLGSGTRGSLFSLSQSAVKTICDHLACLRELNRKLSRWDFLPCLARVVKLLPEGDANRSALSTRLDQLSDLHDAVADAMECESLEQLDDAILLTSGLPGWSTETLALQERRRALVLAAMKVAKALRCYDETLILTALRSAERFDSFAADVVTLSDRLDHVRKMASVAMEEVSSEVDTKVWLSKFDALVAQLGSKVVGNEVSFFHDLCEVAQHVEALSLRVEAAQQIEKQPTIRAAAEKSLAAFLQPIACTVRAPWPREALIFVKRCADPSRLSSKWLRQHFVPLRSTCNEIERAAVSHDFGVLQSAIGAAKRYHSLKNATAGLEARCNALKLSARCDRQESVSAMEAEAAIVAVERSDSSLVGGHAMDKAMATLHDKAGRPPPQAKVRPDVEPQPKPELKQPPGHLSESSGADADLLAAATAGDLDSLVRLLAVPPPVPEAVPDPEPRLETVDRKQQHKSASRTEVPADPALLCLQETAPTLAPAPAPESQTLPKHAKKQGRGVGTFACCGTLTGDSKNRAGDFKNRAGDAQTSASSTSAPAQAPIPALAAKPAPEPEPESESELESETESGSQTAAEEAIAPSQRVPKMDTPSMVELLAAAAASGNVLELTRLLQSTPPESTLRVDGGPHAVHAKQDPSNHPEQAASSEDCDASGVNAQSGPNAKMECTEVADMPPSQPVGNASMTPQSVDAAINLLISSGALSAQPAGAAAFKSSPNGANGEPHTPPSQLQGPGRTDLQQGVESLQPQQPEEPTAATTSSLSIADAIKLCKATINSSSEGEMTDAILAAQEALTTSVAPGKEADLRECSSQVTARLTRLRLAVSLLEQVESDTAGEISATDTANLIAQATTACQDWPHLIPRLKTLIRRLDRADQKRERREARIRRSIAAAKRSGEVASIEAASAAAAAAGLEQEAEQLSEFAASLAFARKLMKKASSTKDLSDIERARAEAAQYECLRRTQQFSDLQSLAASSPGPGQYGKKTPRHIGESCDVDSPGVSWDTSGVWAWKEIKVRDANGGVNSQHVRVQCANASVDNQRSRENSAALGPGTYGEVSPAVYIPGVKQNHSEVDSSFASESRQAISKRHDLHHSRRPGPGDYASATHRPAFDPALPENLQQKDSSFSAPSREVLQEREARWKDSSTPVTESYDLSTTSAFGPPTPLVDESGLLPMPETLSQLPSRAVFKEVVVNGVKGWARVERS